jgi:hypothetical protein
MQNTRRKVIHTCCCSDNQSSESITSHLVSSKCFDDCSTISVIPAGNQKSHVIFLHKLKLCNRQTSRQQLCKELFTFENILTDQFFFFILWLTFVFYFNLSLLPEHCFTTRSFAATGIARSQDEMVHSCFFTK